MAVIIFTLAYSSILLTRMADDLAVLWLPNAFTAVVLVCTREVNRSGIYVGAAAAITLANLAFGDPLWRAAAFAGANLFEIILLFQFYRLAMRGDWPTDNLAAMIRFLSMVVLPAVALSSIPGAGIIVYAFDAPFFESVVDWFLNETVSIVAVFPLALLCYSRSKHRMSITKERLLISVGVFSLVEGILALGVFLDGIFLSYFLTVPVMAIAALVCGRGGIVLINSALLVTMTLEGLVLGEMPEHWSRVGNSIWAFSLIYFCIVLPALLVSIVTDSLRSAEKMAWDTSQNKTNFISMVSHETLTPLNVISGMFQLLARQALPEQLQARVSTGKAAAQSLEKLLRQFLTVCELEDGTLSLDVQPVPVRRIFDAWYDVTHTLLLHSGKPVHLILNNKVPGEETLMVDEARLMQALSSLASNAVKFSDFGHIALLVERTEDRLVFRIIDEGNGIHPDNAKNIFERYWQVDSGPSRNADGVGLGLPVARDLVRLMGGQIDVLSRRSKGAEFTVSFPVDAGTALAQV